MYLRKHILTLNQKFKEENYLFRPREKRFLKLLKIRDHCLEIHNYDKANYCERLMEQL